MGGGIPLHRRLGSLEELVSSPSKAREDVQAKNDFSAKCDRTPLLGKKPDTAIDLVRLQSVLEKFCRSKLTSVT